MAGHVTNVATKFEDPTPIRSWFMSYNVFPLITIENAYAATGAESRDPPVGCQKQLHF